MGAMDESDGDLSTGATAADDPIDDVGESPDRAEEPPGDAEERPPTDEQSEAPPAVGPPEEEIVPGISDDGIVLAFAGAACLLAALNAATTDQSLLVVAFAVVAGVVAVVAVAADVLAGFVPDTRVHLAVGGAALLGGLAAAPGRHWPNVATLGVAAALAFWRVVDVEFRGAER